VTRYLYRFSPPWLVVTLADAKGVNPEIRGCPQTEDTLAVCLSLPLRKRAFTARLTLTNEGCRLYVQSQRIQRVVKSLTDRGYESENELFGSACRHNTLGEDPLRSIGLTYGRPVHVTPVNVRTKALVRHLHRGFHGTRGSPMRRLPNGSTPIKWSDSRN
jgi:hypothetical protein